MHLLIYLLLTQSLSVSAPWIPAPAADATTAIVHLVVENPTMYDVYVMSATSDAAEAVELRESDGHGGTRPASSLTASAYGSLEMTEAGPHLRLTNLTRPIKAGDTVAIVLATDGGERLTVAAIVK
ncbi:MAG: copper chaperone PCu(A)C [Vicinamibacterales bacterium]|nr:copper chaperone PCu(A)C [Vicinamibacterales bacterium]